MGRSLKTLALCTALMVLSGCGGTLLANRTILRGIILDRGEEALWSVIFCWDSLTEEGAMDSTAGEGNTLEEALYQARSKLKGEAFYGQLQQVLVTDQLTYGQLQEAGELFTDPKIALPEVKLAVLESSWEKEQEPMDALEQVEQVFQRYGIDANLYEIARRQGCMVLPVIGDRGLGCRVICQNGKILQWSQGEGQLALILAGLADRYEMEWKDGETLCLASGRGSASFVWEDSRVEVCLWMTRARLEGGRTSGYDQEERFRQWAQNAGKVILEQAGELEADPFLLIPQVKNHSLVLGRQLVEENRLPPASLTVQIWFAP